MKNKFNNKKVINEIKQKGYCVLDNYFSISDIKKIKKSLLLTLNYIDSKDSTNDLQKKYFIIKKYNKKLKGNFYDISARNMDIFFYLHNPSLVKLVKNIFKTKVLFSGRPAIHIHDDENDKLLDPHQETSQMAVDTILFWSPLYDTNKRNGGLTVYDGSHKHGYFDHTLEHPRLGKKAWTNQYTHVSPDVASRFKRNDLKIKAGSAVLMHSSVIHSGYPLKRKGFARFVITERFNPLKKIPYLRDEKASFKIPFVGIDYNKIED